MELWPVDDVGRNRDDVDDRAAAALEHDATLGLAAKKHAFEVDVENFVPVGLADILDVAADGNAGAVDTDVELVPRGEDGVDGIFDIVPGGDVGGDG